VQSGSQGEKKCKIPANKILLIITLAGCLIFAGFSWANKTVTLNMDDKKQNIQAFALTVEQLLKAENIQLQENDRVKPGRSEFLHDGMTVTVKRAVPLTLKADGSIKKVYTHSSTVQALLEEFGITLQAEDSVSPAMEKPIERGMVVEVVRQKTQIVEEEVSIPNKTVKQNSAKLPRGNTKVVQQGHPGLVKKVWQITYRNGKEHSRELKSKEIIRQPVDRIVEVGSAKIISRGGKTVRYAKAIDMVSTAYTYTGNNTASGVPPRRGVVAVDPSVIPLGTRLYVDGYGYCTALDRGSAIKGNKIDVFLESRQQAYRWGVRQVKVYVLE